MATIKKYIKPCITIVSINNTNTILCSSDVGMEHICSEFCKFWHMCQDRAKGKYCSDKKYH